MATPRNRWSKLPTEIRRLPLTREQLLTAVLLQAALTDRWADDKPDSKLGRATFTRGEIRDITGRGWGKSVRNSLEFLSNFFGFSVEFRGEFVQIEWPNYAEFLKSDARKTPARRPRNARSVQVQVSSEQSALRASALKTRPALSAPPGMTGGPGGATVAASAAPENPRGQMSLVPDRKPGRRARVKTPVPAEFTAEQRMHMRVWCGEEKPEWIPHLDALTRECLDHFRGSGEGKVDWIATVRNWVRRNAWRHIRDAEPPRTPRAAGMNAGSIGALWPAGGYHGE